jgi:DNA-binding response OmpR family regulator
LAQILFIEDKVELHTIVTESLQPEHVVTCVKSTSEARDKLINNVWDLLIVDIGLGDGNGLEFMSEMKNSKTTPFIFLTGRTDIEDKLKAFATGAQDYITKPFDSRELKVRVNARLKSGQAGRSETFQNKQFKIEVPLQRAYFVGADQEVALNLTPIEFKLLYYFCSNENRIINRDEILGVVWGKNVNVLQRTIDKHISSLRQKLGPAARQIETVPQVGYRYSS